ncbi:MAG: UDP-N-acetylmuramoyl-tripeptide--D-alanyl-D-alanine ligase [Sphingomonadaceae bacterium]
MSPLWTSTEIAAATGGTASAPFDVTGVAFDSREVGSGDLFIALAGDVTDGHQFLDGAFAKGAAGAIISSPCNFPHIRVEHTSEALNALGVAARWRTTAKAVGVTGSVGKTGTKEALAAALARSNCGPVHRSVKSYNNHTGVPLSLARMPADTAYGVFEMGMNHAGELAALTQLVRPHVALITAIAAAHIEFFDSIEGIADAKAEIFQGLEPGGTAIIPFDSPHRDRLVGHAQSYASRIMTFGRGDGADIRAIEAIKVDAGTVLTVALLDAELSFTLSQPGDHWVSNALAVIAAVSALGGDLAAAGLALADFEGLAGRGAQHSIRIGDGAGLLIDESYNANPTSMAATLAVLGAVAGLRRIAVLGAMRELGADSDALHAGLAEPIIAAGVDLALLVGSGMEPLAKSLEGRVNFAHVADAASAQAMLFKLTQPGDAILIKGSNAIGLSQIVVALTSGLS